MFSKMVSSYFGGKGAYLVQGHYPATIHSTIMADLRRMGFNEFNIQEVSYRCGSFGICICGFDSAIRLQLLCCARPRTHRRVMRYFEVESHVCELFLCNWLKLAKTVEPCSLVGAGMRCESVRSLRYPFLGCSGSRVSRTGNNIASMPLHSLALNDGYFI